MHHVQYMQVRVPVNLKVMGVQFESCVGAADSTSNNEN